ncbi:MULTISPECIES: hypothetical protein [Pseudofrankia]|uniref:hypothetical protein n=1 Tax=Pseudofrankia TaxID=2994363 RepID=UPI000234CE2A|nr:MULTISPECIES: hypothetical protein [Pseudofrankia]OHV28169.1 hypothetical protein BCD49_38225 [Pseudofrankia sp. EUN1h]
MLLIISLLSGRLVERFGPRTPARGVALLGGIVAGSHSVAAGTRVGLAVAAAAYLLAALVCGALPGRLAPPRPAVTNDDEGDTPCA